MWWWQWVLCGLLLLAAELSVVVADFYLVFIGLAAIATGLVLVGVPLAPATQWAVFAACAVIGLVFFRAKVYAYLKTSESTVGPRLVGETLVLPAALAAHTLITVEFRGSTWTVRHAEVETLPAGTLVQVVALEGLTLLVQRADG